MQCSCLAHVPNPAALHFQRIGLLSPIRRSAGRRIQGSGGCIDAVAASRSLKSGLVMGDEWSQSHLREQTLHMPAASFTQVYRYQLLHQARSELPGSDR